MDDTTFFQLQRYVGFSERDARVMASLAEPLSSYCREIVELFYRRIVEHDEAFVVVQRSGAHIDRLQQTFVQWLTELFCGTYDRAYLERRRRIGRAHVRVGLPQHYMFTGMSVFRTALHRAILEAQVTNRAAAIDAVNKLLDLELAIMNDTYREDLLSRMQGLERSQFERQLSESEHLAGVGRLAATLAHELKNPLAGISGAMQIFANSIESDHPHRETIDEILRQIDRLNASVSDLLVYAKPRPPERAQVDICQCVRSVLTCLRGDARYQSRHVECELPSKPLYGLYDEPQIQQLLMNLLLNAVHAAPVGGQVSLSLREQKDRIEIEICDNGGGMTAEVRDRAFEPFYTTKTAGTGLGLAICKRIVEAHGGEITLMPGATSGTRVVVTFPKVPCPSPES